MTYTLSPNCQNAIANLRTMSDQTLNDYVNAIAVKRDSAAAGLMRTDQSFDDRLRFLQLHHELVRVYYAAWDEIEWRLHTPCETCGDEGHVEDIDSPYDTIRECPTCS